MYVDLQKSCGSRNLEQSIIQESYKEVARSFRSEFTHQNQYSSVKNDL